MIPFNKSANLMEAQEGARKALASGKTSGDGEYTKLCNKWLSDFANGKGSEDFLPSKALLTTSGTHALEMAAILADIKPGDEVIMPSYTFVSTANAFVLRGARIKFVDIRPDTMNINEKLIEAAITEKTRAIVPVHYAGVACEMYKIMDLAASKKLYVIEDAAQGVMSTYKDMPLGGIGDLGCYSFHETKNYSMGEGGAIVVNNLFTENFNKNSDFSERAEIIREKGTDRSKFLRGQVDKYSWVDIGSSYLPSDINAAYLYPQLEKASEINHNRLNSWDLYYKLLIKLEEEGRITLPIVPEDCKHNAHMFYIKCKDIDERSKLIEHLKMSKISAVFHYVPLHSAVAGIKYGDFIGEDKYTTSESERLLRLPMYYDLSPNDIHIVVEEINKFYKNK
ncbi:MAG: dTDP-4-amino-4,6-dideoxygalactose transaminase [Anaerovoracaceae bacterium]